MYYYPSAFFVIFSEAMLIIAFAPVFVYAAFWDIVKLIIKANSNVKEPVKKEIFFKIIGKLIMTILSVFVSYFIASLIPYVDQDTYKEISSAQDKVLVIGFFSVLFGALYVVLINKLLKDKEIFAEINLVFILLLFIFFLGFTMMRNPENNFWGYSIIGFFCGSFLTIGVIFINKYEKSRTPSQVRDGSDNLNESTN